MTSSNPAYGATSLEATIDETAITEDMFPVITSSHPAYQCAVEKVTEDRAYKNVDLFEATTLFYTTSDGTRTYRPPEQATEKAAIPFGEVIATTLQ